MNKLHSYGFRAAALIVCGLGAYACGDDTGTGGAAAATGTTTTGVTSASSSTHASSASGSGTTTGSTAASTSSGGSGCSGATPVALKVKNYLSWCTVTVDGKAPVAGPDQTVCVAEGAIDVSAVANAGFVLGATPWHDTDGDTGDGELGTVTGTGQTASSATTVTVAGTADCAWVCCHTAGETDDCPTADQCP